MVEVVGLYTVTRCPPYEVPYTYRTCLLWIAWTLGPVVNPARAFGLEASFVAWVMLEVDVVQAQAERNGQRIHPHPRSK